MEQDSLAQRLSQISTLWSVVFQAHGDQAEAVLAARQKMLRHYSKAVSRYLLGALRDPEAASDLSQEFALRFMEGGLRGADPGRGRFRDFVKGVLFHMIADYHRRRPPPQPLPGGGWEPEASAEECAAAERQFLDSWREELLARAWEALARVQDQTGRPLHAVLRCRLEHPDLRSPELAERLSAQLGKPVTAAAFRQGLHRAREKFADLLLEDVMQTLANPTVEDLEQELIDLGLFVYCQPALQQRTP